MITSCETTVQVHGIDVEVRVKYDQDNGRYMAQIYDDRCGEFYRRYGLCGRLRQWCGLSNPQRA